MLQVRIVGRLESHVLNTHRNSLLPRLRDEDATVCVAALAAMRKCDHAWLATRAEDLLALLNPEERASVRYAALSVLCLLPIELVAATPSLVSTIAPLLGDEKHPNVAWGAAQVLRRCELTSREEKGWRQSMYHAGGSRNGPWDPMALS